MAWISIKDKLPDNDTVIIVYDGKDVDTGLYISGVFVDCYDTVLDVTHWQELPEPPKED